MSIDPKIRLAIETAVRDAGQPDGLAHKIARWFEAVASGNENITDRQSANRHLELLYEEAQSSSVQFDKVIDDIITESTFEADSIDEQEAC